MKLNLEIKSINCRCTPILPFVEQTYTEFAVEALIVGKDAAVDIYKDFYRFVGEYDYKGKCYELTSVAINISAYSRRLSLEFTFVSYVEIDLNTELNNLFDEFLLEQRVSRYTINVLEFKCSKGSDNKATFNVQHLGTTCFNVTRDYALWLRKYAGNATSVEFKNGNINIKTGVADAYVVAEKYFKRYMKMQMAED